MVSFWVKTLCLCLVLMTIFCVSPFLPAMWPCHHRNRLVLAEWTDLNYYSLALSQLNIDLMCDEEIMNPERLAEAPENASIAPGAMKVRSGNKKQLAKMTSHTSHPQVAWATFLLERTGHLTKDESLSNTMKIGSRWREVKMPPPLPKRVLIARIRDDRALHKFYSNFHKMHRATSGDAYTQAWFDNLWENSLRTLRELFERINSPMQHPLQQCEFLQPEKEFSGPKKPNKAITKGESSISPQCHFSGNSGETTTRMWHRKQRLTAYRQIRSNCLRTGLVGWN